MCPLWNPRDVLQLDDIHACAGWAYSQHRKCHNPIAKRNRLDANRLVLAMGTLEPNPVGLEGTLRTLACLLLCRRWHQDQVDELVEEWSEKIQGLVTTRAEALRTRQRRSAVNRPESGPSSRPRHSSGMVPISSATALGPSPGTVSVASTPSAVPRGTASRALEANLVAPAISSDPVHAVRNGASSSRSIDGASATVVSRRAIATQIRRPTPNAEAGPSSSTPTESTTQPQIRELASGRSSTPPCSSRTLSGPSFLASTLSRTAPGPSTAAAIPVAQPCPRGHVPLLPADDICGICTMEFEPDDALVRCKRRCGRQLHKDCMDAWVAQRVSQRMRPNCIHCRASWISETCECDG
jgi:hypothetical protein